MAANSAVVYEEFNEFHFAVTPSVTVVRSSSITIDSEIRDVCLGRPVVQSKKAREASAVSMVEWGAQHAEVYRDA